MIETEYIPPLLPLKRAPIIINMKTLLMVTALTLASAVSVWTQTIDLPRPWLTLDRSTKVLHLQCKPPQEAHLHWKSVRGLELCAFLPQHNLSTNISLVKITSSQKVPKVNVLFKIHNATFQGDWYYNFVSLDFLFPVTDKELGRYFCTMNYSHQADTFLNFTREAVVNQDFVSSHTHTQPKNINGFFVKVIDTHEVRVTWRKPESSKFTEASVSRMFVGEGGKPTAPSMSLFTTNGIRHLEYNSGVILTHFTSGHNGNLSIALYVESDAHSLSYRYTCRVPYPACTGHGAVSCTCCQRADNPNTPVCPTPPEDCQTYKTLFVVFLVLFIVVVVVFIVVLTMRCLYKTGRCRNNARFQKIFTPKRESTTTEQQTSLPLELMTDQTVSCPSGRKEENEVNTDDSKKDNGVDCSHKGTISRQKEAKDARQPQSTTGRQGQSSCPPSLTKANDMTDPCSNTTKNEEQTPSTSTSTFSLTPDHSRSDGSIRSGQPECNDVPTESTSAGNGDEELQDSAVDELPTDYQPKVTHDSCSKKSEKVKPVGHRTTGSLSTAGAKSDVCSKLDGSTASVGLPLKTSSTDKHVCFSETGNVNDVDRSDFNPEKQPLLPISETPRTQQSVTSTTPPKRPVLGGNFGDLDSGPGERRSKSAPT